MIDVVAAVIKKENKYLIAQRNRNKHFAFHWEFPGGKVDNEETFENALQREIKEELSINIKIYKKVSSQKHKDDKIITAIKIYVVELYNLFLEISVSKILSES